MLVLIFIVPSLSAFGQLRESAQADTVHLTLIQAIELAKEQSVDAAVAKNKEKTAYWSYRTFRAEQLPEVSFQGTLPDYRKNYVPHQNSDGSYSYVRNNYIGMSGGLYVTQNIPLTGGKISLGTSLDYNKQFGAGSYQEFMSVPISITLSQPILAANSFKWDRRIEPVRYEEAQAQFAEEMEEVTISTVAYFFNYVLAQSKLDIAKQNYENAQKLYEVAEARRQLGNISESEMFGHKKGAFTEAYTDRTGRFELADHGTIFLDEIGDLDPSCQVKLLRVLQDQTFEVLGDSRQRKVDVRVVSATNRDLTQMVADHTFREDLFYRINLIPIHIPPLRERRKDIPLLAQYFARQSADAMPSSFDPHPTSAISGRAASGCAASSPMAAPDIAPDALEYLQSLPFIGNVRELKNLVERTIIVCGKPLLHREDFQAQYSALHPSGETHASRGGSTLEDLEHDHIMEILTKNEGNVARTARELGISRAALYRRLDKYREDGQ